MNNSDKYFENSRFISNVKMHSDDEGKARAGRFELTRIEKSNSDFYYQVTSAQAYRLDLISLEFYGTTKLGWVLALANNKTSLLDWPVAGDTLRIPAYDVVQRYL